MHKRFAHNPIYWYERSVRQKAWMALDEAAVFPDRKKETRLNADLLARQFHPDAVVAERNDFVIYVKAPIIFEQDLILERLSVLRALDGVRQASPVFYTSRKNPDTRLVFIGEIIVQFPSGYSEERVGSIERKYAIKRLKAFSFDKNTFFYNAGEPMHALEVANSLFESGQVNYAYPDWLRSRSKRTDGAIRK